MGTLIPIPEPLGSQGLLELARRNARLGEKAATRNELVREFWRESPPKRGPVAGKREIVSGGDRNSARANPAIPQSGCTQPGAGP